MSDEPPKIPELPGGPDPTKPVPRDPVGGVSLERYAEVSAALAEPGRPRAEALAAAGVNELAWLEIEKTWLLRMAVAGMQGDTAMIADFDRAYTAAQDALGPPEPVRPLERYAALVARLEAGHPPARVLVNDGLSIPDWARLQRAWTRRIAGDPALRARYEAAHADEKHRLAAPRS